MKLDLNEIASTLGKQYRYEIEEPPIEDPEHGLKGIEPITGQMVFSNASSAIVVRGKFQTAIEVECARCLKSFQFKVESPIEEALLLSEPLEGTSEDEDEEEPEPLEDEAEPIFVDNIFDLTEFLRQSILVAVPIKPLCSEACKGLCPQCGAILSDEPCECMPDTDASPFGALAALLEEAKEDEEEKP